MTKKTSAKKKLLPAIGMLAISGAMLASSTFAWFTMNKSVEVTGMKVHTVVGSNLLISETNANAASYGNSLEQTRECLLEPASTVNGINYFFTSTSNVDARGDAKTNTYTAYNETESWTSAHTAAGKTKFDQAFNTNYGLGTIEKDTDKTYNDVAYGYVDYTFYLKAVNSETTPQDLILDKLELKYDNGTVSEKAWRAALIVDEATEYVAYSGTLASTNVKSIYSMPSATNFESGKAVASTTATGVLAYGTENATTAYNATAVLDNVGVGATKYYYVTVRLWLEGEDETCNNSTFATLTDDYTLDLEFSMADGKTGVTSITTPAAP